MPHKKSRILIRLRRRKGPFMDGNYLEQALGASAARWEVRGWVMGKR